MTAATTDLRTAHVVVPYAIDDPQLPSGGNVYDRQVCVALTSAGWQLSEHPVPGAWPTPSTADLAALAEVVAGVPDGATLLVDGLIASAAPSVLVPGAQRLRLVVLIHMPLVRAEEGAVLSAAASVVTTSDWTRRRLLEEYSLAPDRVQVVEPGVRAAEVATGTPTGDRLLCVAAVTSAKGHADLLAALTRNVDLPWHCACVGTLGRDPGLVDQLRHQAAAAGLGDRFVLSGPMTGDLLDNAYAAADLLVLASHSETYGMVVTEALARGLPAIATAVGGVPDALGQAVGGQRPGLLVEPGDPLALAAALRRWLTDAELRRELRATALRRRDSLLGWEATAERLAAVLLEAGR